MFIPKILLAFAASASAIDIYLKTGDNCGNFNSIVCRGINPDTCCGADTTIFPSVGFYGIPTNWVISVRGHNGGRCNRLREQRRVANTNFACLTNGWFSGGGYGFTNKKRDAGDAPAEPCAKPDLLELVDGVQYNLVDLDDSTLDTLVCSSLSSCGIPNLAIAGTNVNSTGIPKEFDAYKIEA